jgi:DNA-binding NarL/FixJ family response regulator
VAIIDDHPAIVASIGAAIEAAPDMVLAGTAGSLAEADALLEPHVTDIDVLLLDLQLESGAEGLRLLAMLDAEAPDRGDGDGPAVMILSGFDQPSLVRAAFERGASGYVVKTADVPEILDAIRAVAAGGTTFSAAAVRSVRSAPRLPSDRELEVLALIGAGASNAETAGSLGLSEKTIESHLRRMFDRYGVLSRTELAVLAINERWIPRVGTSG